jgi:hypothetical protein
MGAILTTIGNLLFSVGLNTLNIFAKTAAINVAIAAGATAAVAIALGVFLDIAAGYVGTLVSQASTIPAIPYFLPSNMAYCLGAYTAVVLGGTIFNAVVNFIERRAYILKA